MRIACFFIPLFPLAARLRSEPELGGSALVIVEGSGTTARVFAASRRARKQGVRAGVTLAQARAILPGLIARARDLECERAAQEALLDVAESLSPRVEDAGEGVAYLDLEGLERIYGHGMQNAECRVENGKKDRGFKDAGPGESPFANLEVPRPSRTPTLARDDKPAMSSREVSAASDEGSPERKERRDSFGGSLAALGMTSAQPPSAQRPSPSSTLHSAFCIHFSQHALLSLERAGLPARVGIASSKLAARVAAELPETPTIVPVGEESAFLAPLPLGRLAIEMAIAERLARWGIRSIGDFARLPEREVASRLGETGRALHHAARGIDPRPLIPRFPPPDFREGMDLEWPLVSLEPFLFVANAALDRLTRRLAAHGLACRRLELELRLEPDGWHVRAIELPAPTRDVKTLVTLTRLDLEEHPPGAPVAGFIFVAHPDQPRAAQLSLYGPLALSPDRLATTIARLAALVGTDRVGTPYPVDSHVPERFTIADYAPPSPPKVRLEPAHNRGLLAVRVLRPAVELAVERMQNAECRVENEERRDFRDADHQESPFATALARDDNSVMSSREASAASDEAGHVIPRSEQRGIPRESEDLVTHEGDPSLALGMTRPQIPGPSPQPLSSPFSTLHSASCIPSFIKALHPNDTLKIDGAVRVASGPWTMEEGWWSDAPVEREYWDVELARGAIYRIYRDRDGRWFADGVYD